MFTFYYVLSIFSYFSIVTNWIFFSFVKHIQMAKLPCTDAHNGVSALKYTCQSSKPQIFSAILYYYVSPSVFVSEKRSVNFLRGMIIDFFECQERNDRGSSWYLRLYVQFFSNIIHSVLFLLVLLQSDTANKYLNRGEIKEKAM